MKFRFLVVTLIISICQPNVGKYATHGSYGFWIRKNPNPPPRVGLMISIKNSSKTLITKKKRKKKKHATHISCGHYFFGIKTPRLCFFGNRKVTRWVWLWLLNSVAKSGRQCRRSSRCHLDDTVSRLGGSSQDS